MLVWPATLFRLDMHEANQHQWTLPVLPNDHTGTDHPNMLHYPHFATSAVHSDYIDWYGGIVIIRSPAVPGASV